MELVYILLTNTKQKKLEQKEQKHNRPLLVRNFWKIPNKTKCRNFPQIPRIRTQKIPGTKNVIVIVFVIGVSDQTPLTVVVCR